MNGSNECCAAYLSSSDTNDGQRINSTVYVKVLSEPMNFPPSVIPSKAMGGHKPSFLVSQKLSVFSQ